MQGGCKVSPETQQRIDTAIRALAMPVHWYYNVAALQRDFGTLRNYQAPKDFHPNSILSPASLSRGRRGSQVHGTPIGE